MIEILKTEQQLRKFTGAARQAGKSIGVVPTMGALHEGHLSLVQHSNDQTDCTIVTIFVNPTQFAPNEDLSKYPRDLERDLELLRQHQVDAVFAPDKETIYPQGFSTSVQPPAVAKLLEGEFRPEHFQGVATVVLKLFNLVTADRAFFGQKDFQQVAVVKQMVRDLNVPVEVVVCPIVRDQDGLALSSRNVYLDQEQRQRALSLSKTLQLAVEAIEQGESDGHIIMAEMNQNLIDGGVSDIDYAVIADPVTLKAMNQVRKPAVLLVAAFVDQVRLIDNRVLEN